VIFRLLDVFKYLQELEDPVFHANVKPSNVFIDADYNVYLTDFAFNYRSLSTKELIAQKYSFVSPESIVRTKLESNSAVGTKVLEIRMRFNQSRIQV